MAGFDSIRDYFSRNWAGFIRYYEDHFLSDKLNRDDGLPYLRNRLFISTLLFTFPLCILVYVPSIVGSLFDERYAIVLVDTLALSILVFIFFTRKLRISQKKSLFAFNFYLLSLVLLYFLTTRGPSMVILVSTSVILALFHNTKAGAVSIILNTITLIVYMIFAPFNSWPPVLFQDYNQVMTIAVGVNFFAFNMLIILAVSTLLEYLNKSLLEEKNLQILLRKESSDLMVAKQKAEESDRLKSAFLANMSHEIRTPMNGIMGFSALLNDPGFSGEEQKEFIRIIQNSGARLLNIINEIIDISKIESGEMQVDLSEVDVNEQVDFVYTLLHAEAQQKNLNFRCVYGLHHNDAMIITDGNKLSTILTNLVKNAIKYTDTGSIEFGYALIPAASDDPKSGRDQLEFFVSDTGIGIPLSRQKAIFDRFVQADIEDIEARQGAGLGLSIAKAFVELLHGTIGVTSEPARGSTFHFRIPFQKPRSEKIITQPQVHETGNKMMPKKLNILIVEDDEPSQFYLEHVVSAISEKIYLARSGTEAVELCRANPATDLILMDVRMPGMSGNEAVRLIREFNRDVVIIAQTGHALKEDREMSMDAGCNDYITKPVKKSELLEVIYRHFDSL